MRLDAPKKNSSHGSGKWKREDFKTIGDDAVLEDNVLVFHAGNISIGRNVYVGHGTVLKGYHRNEMVIGDNTWIGQGCFFHSAGGIRIGQAVGIGPGVKILTSAHQDHDLELPILFHPVTFSEVIIEDGSDLGVGSIILPGVRVGKGAIVGAGAVVTKSVEPYSVVAGCPAKTIRTRGASKNG